MSASGMPYAAIHGHIAARIDRAFWLIPAQWQTFLWISAGIEILLPLLYWQLPESPRWLEAHGRHAGPNHLGWILWIVIPGALVPAILIRGYGINQSRAILEQVST